MSICLFIVIDRLHQPRDSGNVWLTFQSDPRLARVWSGSIQKWICCGILENFTPGEEAEFPFVAICCGLDITVVEETHWSEKSASDHNPSDRDPLREHG
jgi:hypothetical protein